MFSTNILEPYGNLLLHIIVSLSRHFNLASFIWYTKVRMKKMPIVVFLIVFFLGLFPQKIFASSWISNFNYRKTIGITGSSAGAVSNYPIKLTINKGSGTDTGTSVYLNNHVLDSFYDIRFTKSDGTTLLNYWIESSTSNSAVVWVAFDSIPISPAAGSFYLYYGNSTATNGGNGTGTFTLFEDFDSSGITNWTGSNENININEVATQSASTDKYESSPNSAKLYSHANCNTSPWDGVGSILNRSPKIALGTYKIDFSVLRDITGFAFSTTATQESILKINGSSSFSERSTCGGHNCTSVGTWGEKSITVNNSAIDTIALEGYSEDCTTGVTWFDDLRIRDYIDPEPTVTSWGSEEYQAAESAPATQNNNSSSSTSTAPTCNDTKPSNIPDLFQIDINDSQATLYYAPVSKNISGYYISYSEKQNEFMYGVETNQGQSSGVLSFTINMLNPNRVYYFKLRGQNGCMPGDWSNEMIAETKPKGTTSLLSYYRYFASPVLGESTEPSADKSTPVLGAEDVITENPQISSPEPTPITKRTKTPPPTQPKKHCLLFWCW